MRDEIVICRAEYCAGCQKLLAYSFLSSVHVLALDGVVTGRSGCCEKYVATLLLPTPTGEGSRCGLPSGLPLAPTPHPTTEGRE